MNKKTFIRKIDIAKVLNPISSPVFTEFKHEGRHIVLCISVLKDHETTYGVGYSIQHPNDKLDIETAKKRASGRAVLKNKCSVKICTSMSPTTLKINYTVTKAILEKYAHYMQNNFDEFIIRR